MKRFIIAVIISLMSLTGAEAAPIKATLGYTAVVDWLASFVAKDNSYFKKNGLDVTLRLMSNGGVIPPGLLSNSMQIGGITGPFIIQTEAAGFPLKIISGASVATKANPNGWIVVRRGAGIRKPADFKGKRVAAGALGGYYNVLFREWLKNNGVNPRDVHFVEVSFSQISDVMKAGQIDAATIGQPFVSRIVAAKIGRSFSPYTSDFPNGLLSNVYVATAAWIKKHPTAVTGFRNSIKEADAYIAKNPAAARKIAAHYLKLPPNVLNGLPLANYATTVTPAQVAEWSKLMLSQKQIKHNIDPKNVLIP